ncbi:MAG TPA: phage tail tape measure protein, partial [Polyangiaceae bacterium]
MAGRFSIFADFGANDRITGPVRRIKTGLAGLGRGISAAYRPFGSLSSGLAKFTQFASPAIDHFQGIAKGALGAAAALATLAEVQILKTGAEFEKALSNVRAVAGPDAGKGIDALGKKAQELGPKFGFAATEVVGAAESMVKSGYSLTETMAGLQGILAGVAADGGNLEEVSAG